MQEAHHNGRVQKGEICLGRLCRVFGPSHPEAPSIHLHSDRAWKTVICPVIQCRHRGRTLGCESSARRHCDRASPSRLLSHR